MPQKTATAPYWRIRHGTVDRDTCLVVPVILTMKLLNHGAKVVEVCYTDVRSLSDETPISAG